MTSHVFQYGVWASMTLRSYSPHPSQWHYQTFNLITCFPMMGVKDGCDPSPFNNSTPLKSNHLPWLLSSVKECCFICTMLIITVCNINSDSLNNFSKILTNGFFRLTFLWLYSPKQSWCANRFFIYFTHAWSGTLSYYTFAERCVNHFNEDVSAFRITFRTHPC